MTVVSRGLPDAAAGSEARLKHPSAVEKERPLYGVLDVGGTKVAVGIATDDQILGATMMSTDIGGGGDAVVRQVATAMGEVRHRIGLEGHRLSGVGASIPGPLDRRVGWSPSRPTCVGSTIRSWSD